MNANIEEKGQKCLRFYFVFFAFDSALYVSLEYDMDVDISPT